MSPDRAPSTAPTEVMRPDAAPRGLLVAIESRGEERQVVFPRGRSYVGFGAEQQLIVAARQVAFPVCVVQGDQRREVARQRDAGHQCRQRHHCDGGLVDGDQAYYTYQVFNQAIVIPETIDAIRALTGIETDPARSIAKTDASLGLRRDFLR